MQFAKVWLEHSGKGRGSESNQKGHCKTVEVWHLEEQWRWCGGGTLGSKGKLVPPPPSLHPLTPLSPPETTKTPGVKGFKFNSHTLQVQKAGYNPTEQTLVCKVTGN